jgi:hypothetical protein
MGPAIRLNTWTTGPGEQLAEPEDQIADQADLHRFSHAQCSEVVVPISDAGRTTWASRAIRGVMVAPPPLDPPYSSVFLA